MRILYDNFNFLGFYVGIHQVFSIINDTSFVAFIIKEI